MLFDVMLLALDPVRLRAEYRLFQAKPSPMPEPVEEEDDLRAKIRYSIALSRALASRCISLSCSISSRSEASSNIFRRLHSSSAVVSSWERSDGVGDQEGPRSTLS